MLNSKLNIVNTLVKLYYRSFKGEIYNPIYIFHNFHSNSDSKQAIKVVNKENTILLIGLS